VRFCQPHWDKLRAAIEERGLGDVVARDGQAAAANLVSELQTGSRLDNFDPLMGAHWAIVNRIAEVAPQVIVIEGCPICWAQDEHEKHCVDPGCQVTRQTLEDWIPGVADFMKREHGRLRAEAGL